MKSVKPVKKKKLVTVVSDSFGFESWGIFCTLCSVWFFMRREFCLAWDARVISNGIGFILEVDEEIIAVNSAVPACVFCGEELFGFGSCGAETLCRGHVSNTCSVLDFMGRTLGRAREREDIYDCVGQDAFTYDN